MLEVLKRSLVSELESFIAFCQCSHYDLFEPSKVKAEPTVHPETNIAMYSLASTQLYLYHAPVFRVVKNIFIIAITSISTFVVVVVVATFVTVVQLGRVIVCTQSQRQC